MGFVLITIVMFSFWVMLSGHLDFFHLLAGLICSLFVAFLSRGLIVWRGRDAATEAGRVLGFVRYLPWLFYQVLKANVEVAYLTLHPRMPIDPRLVKISSGLRDELGITTLANSITLTPGTVTIDADEEGEMLVHAISREAAESLLEGEMARRVRKIERGGDV